MITPLKKTALHDLINKPILFDANIFMVGISERTSDPNCSFENMVQLYIKPLFESFTEIYPMRRKTPCFSYGDIRRVHRIYASNGRWTKQWLY